MDGGTSRLTSRAPRDPQPPITGSCYIRGGANEKAKLDVTHNSDLTKTRHDVNIQISEFLDKLEKPDASGAKLPNDLERTGAEQVAPSVGALTALSSPHISYRVPGMRAGGGGAQPRDEAHACVSHTSTSLRRAELEAHMRCCFTQTDIWCGGCCYHPPTHR